MHLHNNGNACAWQVSYLGFMNLFLLLDTTFLMSKQQWKYNNELKCKLVYTGFYGIYKPSGPVVAPLLWSGNATQGLQVFNSTKLCNLMHNLYTYTVDIQLFQILLLAYTVYLGLWELCSKISSLFYSEFVLRTYHYAFYYSQIYPLFPKLFLIFITLSSL